MLVAGTPKDCSGRLIITLLESNRPLHNSKIENIFVVEVPPVVKSPINTITMPNEQMNRAPFALHGSPWHKLRSVLALCHSSLYVSFRRMIKGPLLPNWSWNTEAAIHFLKAQNITGFEMRDHAEGRAYEDALVFNSPAVARVNIEAVSSPVKGQWYQAKSGNRPITLLYFHGGGYAYYSKAHENLIALVTLAVESKTFAPDYRLTPEHPFPAQLEDALATYQWLLGTGTDPNNLVIAGDSAGGNLTLALLLSLRDAGQPLPAMAVCIAPWTDVGNSGESMTKNEIYDWVEKRMAVQWAEWLCKGADPRNPLISPIHANLNGLPPIYIQAGDAEILYDMINEFAAVAGRQGANVTLDVWKNMNHDFQAFGDMTPESKEALQRIRRVVDKQVLPSPTK
jgi:monoterpene epsilon-lactone hydrolase